MVLIGLIGYKGSGKSTMGRYIVEHFNYIEFAFADPVKDICKILFSLTDDDVNLKKNELNLKWGITNRQILQKFGTDICRDELPKFFPQIDKSIWIKIMENKISKYKNVVISDVRFEDEAKMIKDNNGILIKINKDDLIKEDKHKSENSNLQYDIEINNNGSIIHFEQNITKLLNGKLFFNTKKSNIIEILHNKLDLPYYTISIIFDFLSKKDLINLDFYKILHSNFMSKSQKKNTSNDFMTNPQNNIIANDGYDRLLNNTIKRFSVNEIYKMQMGEVKTSGFSARPHASLFN